MFPLLLVVLKKGRQYTELVLVRRPSKLVYVSQSVQCSSDSRIQKAASAEVFTVIVTCMQL
jgi:hypothetical protein